MRGLARIYDVRIAETELRKADRTVGVNCNKIFRQARPNFFRIAQFVLKIEKLSHIMGPRGHQDLRSPSPIMAPV